MLRTNILNLINPIKKETVVGFWNLWTWGHILKMKIINTTQYLIQIQALPVGSFPRPQRMAAPLKFLWITVFVDTLVIVTVAMMMISYARLWKSFLPMKKFLIENISLGSYIEFLCHRQNCFIWCHISMPDLPNLLLRWGKHSFAINPKSRKIQF